MRVTGEEEGGQLKRGKSVERVKIERGSGLKHVMRSTVHNLMCL